MRRRYLLILAITLLSVLGFQTVSAGVATFRDAPGVSQPKQKGLKRFQPKISEQIPTLRPIMIQISL
jgi:hypothetical protein